MNLRSIGASSACFATAPVWPWLVGALAKALLSPIDGIGNSAWCGVPYHWGFAFLGHCSICWLGSALIAATGLLLLLAPDSAVLRFRARNRTREIDW